MKPKKLPRSAFFFLTLIGFQLGFIVGGLTLAFSMQTWFIAILLLIIFFLLFEMFYRTTLEEWGIIKPPKKKEKKKERGSNGKREK